jgi:hypothetical protein
MKWLKYRFSYSEGPGSFYYKPLYVDELSQSFIEDTLEILRSNEEIECGFSNKFHGIKEYTFIEDKEVPLDVIIGIKEEIERAYVNYMKKYLQINKAIDNYKK